MLAIFQGFYALLRTKTLEFADVYAQPNDICTLHCANALEGGFAEYLQAALVICYNNIFLGSSQNQSLSY
jgi:hypothetical protein